MRPDLRARWQHRTSAQALNPLRPYPLYTPLSLIYALIPYIRPYPLYTPLSLIYALIPYIRPYPLYTPLSLIYALIPYIRPYPLYTPLSFQALALLDVCLTGWCRSSAS
jgi:hypothetical protein